MKKLAILFVALASMTMTAVAQCPNGDNPRCQKPTCDRQAGPQDKMYRPTDPFEKAMEGILLTQEQQQKVDALRAECQAQKAQCDSSKRACRKQSRKECIAKMKEILTPEQYTLFLENIVNSQDMGPRAMRMARVHNMGRECAKANPVCAKDKADCKKADCKKADCKKGDCKKADCKKADCKKADCKKADCKKGDCKKGDKKCDKKCDK